MDPPAFRHTVIYGPSVPEPIVPPQEGEAEEQDGAEGGSVVLALTDGRAELSSVSGLLLDSNKSVSCSWMCGYWCQCGTCIVHRMPPPPPSLVPCPNRDCAVTWLY